jgi:hemoglobin
MKPDIITKEDIQLLVNQFYAKAKTDQLIGKFFTIVAEVDWESHLPKMYNFWESVILGKRTYSGNPMKIHFALNQKEALLEEHFARWVNLFHATIDENFKGRNSQQAKTSASTIALALKTRITNAKE